MSIETILPRLILDDTKERTNAFNEFLKEVEKPKDNRGVGSYQLRREYYHALIATLIDYYMEHIQISPDKDAIKFNGDSSIIGQMVFNNYYLNFCFTVCSLELVAELNIDISRIAVGGFGFKPTFSVKLPLLPELPTNPHQYNSALAKFLAESHYIKDIYNGTQWSRPAKDCFTLSRVIKTTEELRDSYDIDMPGVSQYAFNAWLLENELKAKVGISNDGSIGYGLEYIPKQKQ